MKRLCDFIIKSLRRFLTHVTREKSTKVQNAVIVTFFKNHSLQMSFFECWGTRKSKTWSFFHQKSTHRSRYHRPHAFFMIAFQIIPAACPSFPKDLFIDLICNSLICESWKSPGRFNQTLPHCSQLLDRWGEAFLNLPPIRLFNNRNWRGGGINFLYKFNF